MEIFSSFPCGSLLLVYFRSGERFDCALIPADMRERMVTDDRPAEGMIQFKPADAPFGGGAAYSLRNSPCQDELKFLSQEDSGGKIVTAFRYGDGLFFRHVAERHDGWIRIWTEAENRTAQELRFDLLTSFSLGMLPPFSAGNGADCFLERVTERWHHEEVSLARAGLERPNSLRFGSGGTMPVAGYYPFAGIEDRSCGVLWGAALENSGAWMLEFASSGKGLSLSGGMPDAAFCGQSLSVSAGAVYRTPAAVLTCVKGDILDLFNAMQLPLRTKAAPDVSPVYCGPLDRAALSFLKSCGVRYCVTETEDPAQIETAGLIPGVTLDRETFPAGRKGTAFLTRNGVPLQVGKRRFADYRDPERRSAAVRELRLRLQSKHIGYVRFLAPAAFCGGCDGNGSPLENQQEYVDSLFAFYEELHQTMPELVIELCTCGIGRLSAKWLGLADVVTPWEELPDAPEAMAALDRQMLNPSRQCGVPVRLTADGDLAGKLNAALLGRPVLSGNPALLPAEKQEILKRFLALHQVAQPVLRDGTYRLGHIIGESCMVPTGWQMFCKSTPEMQLFVIHTFAELREPVSFDIAEGMQLRMDLPGGLPWRFRQGKLEIGPCKAPASASLLFLTRCSP